MRDKHISSTAGLNFDKKLLYFYVFLKNKKGILRLLRLKMDIYYVCLMVLKFFYESRE